MLLRSIRLLAVAGSFVVAAAGPAAAQTVIVDNSANSRNGVIFGTWNAQQFTTDATAYTLSSVVGYMGNSFGTVSVKMSIHADNAGTPGASLLDLGFQSIATIFSATTWTPSTSFVLNPSTTYWAVAFVDEANSGGLGNNWGTTNDTSSSGPGTLGLNAQSYDGTTYFTDTARTLITVSGVAAIPEAGPLTLSAVPAALGLGLHLRSRRRRRAA